MKLIRRHYGRMGQHTFIQIYLMTVIELAYFASPGVLQSQRRSCQLWSPYTITRTRKIEFDEHGLIRFRKAGSGGQNAVYRVVIR